MLVVYPGLVASAEPTRPPARAASAAIAESWYAPAYSTMPNVIVMSSGSDDRELEDHRARSSRRSRAGPRATRMRDEAPCANALAGS